jgi:hypothetical protein
MVGHLEALVASIPNYVEIQKDDVVCDIGSNDGTLLRSYPQKSLTKIGIDPTATKFRQYYDSATRVVPELFSTEAFWGESPSKARVITSVAMLYDLPSPPFFFESVRSIMANDGVWITEQSYAPWMIASGAFDTICHEHLEYYGLRDLVRLGEMAGLKIISVSTNAVNGGSFRVVYAHRGRSDEVMECPVGRWLLKREIEDEVSSLRVWQDFSARVVKVVASLEELTMELLSANSTVGALGASTKGNVLLQVMNDAASVIQCVGEVNPDKIGKFTPGTHIPILSQREVLSQNFDYLLVLPWHFRSTFLGHLKNHLEEGLKLIFPLPAVEVFQY